MSIERKVVMVGAHGIENAGDDAPLLVMARGLRRLHPEVEFDFEVIARHPDPLIEEAADVRFTSNLEYSSREEAAGRWFRGFNHGDDRSDLRRIEATIRDAHLVVAGAGNVLVDLSCELFRGPIPLLGTYSFLADVHRTPLFLYGISAGPLSTDHGRDLSSWIARRAAAVTVRDRSSAVLLDRLAPEVHAEVLPDPVLALAPCDDRAFEAALAAEGIPRHSRGKRLAVALRDLSFMGHDRTLVVETLERLSDRFELLFIPQSTYRDADDRVEAEAVIRALGGAVTHAVRGRHRPEVLQRFYETADATLAIRLHGAVFSAMRGVPVVALSYLPKVASFVETVGLEDLAFDIELADPRTLAHAVADAAGRDGEPIRRRCMQLARNVGGYLRHASRLMELTTDAAEAA